MVGAWEHVLGRILLGSHSVGLRRVSDELKEVDECVDRGVNQLMDVEARDREKKCVPRLCE